MVSRLAFVFATCAIVVTLAHASNIAEDDWSDQDDVLQQLYDDDEQTPLSQLSQSPATIAAAKAAGDAQGSAAAAAKAMEDKWSAQESDYAKQAAALNKEERALQQKAAADDAAAGVKAANERLAALAKIEETNKASVKAAEKNQKMQVKYNKTIADMATQTAAAKAKSAADLVKYKAEMKKLSEDIATQKAAGKAIEESMAKEAADLKKQQGDIEASFASKKESLKATNKANQEKLAAEEKKAQAGFAAKFKSNADRALAAQAAIAAEAAQNKKDAAAAKAAIELKYQKIKDAHSAADKLWNQKAAADAKALSATREKTKKKFAAKAAQVEADYKRAMGSAHRLQVAADNAQNRFEASMNASVVEQAKVDKAEAAQDAHDAEMAECAIDGSECQNPDGKCIKTDPKKGPFVSDDLVSCTDTKPAEQPYGGEKWAGGLPPLPKTPLKKETAKCKSMKAKLEGAYPDAFKAGTEWVTGVACLKNVDPVAHKQAFLDFFDMAEECPPYCVPGTDTNDGLVSDTNGICIDSDDYMGFKEQISDLPVYKDMGTNGRFLAGAPANLCRMAKAFAEGFGAGAAPPPTPAPTPNATIAPAPAPPLAKGPWALNKNAGLPAGSGAEPADFAFPAVTLLEETVEAAPATIADAKAKKEKAEKDGAAAAAAEKKWSDQEAEYGKEAKALNKDERKLSDDAATANAAAAKAAKDAMNTATEKIADTLKQSAAAEKKYDQLQAKYAQVQADLKDQGKKADTDSAKKAATYKTEMATLKQEMEQEQANAEAIQKDQVAQSAALKAKEAQIAADFKKNSDKLAAEDAQNKANLAGEEKEAQAGFAAKFKSNAAVAAAEQAAIAEEKKENDAAAVAEHKAIDDRYDAVKAADKAKEDLYQKKVAAEAAELKATREATKAKFAAKAAKVEADYQAAKAKANVLQSKADHAHQVWQNEMDASAAEQVKMDKMAEAADEADAEDHECKIDGSECRSTEGKCVAITNDGPYMADDLVSCTDTKPEDQAYSGEAWAGVPPPLPKTPLPKPSDKCKALRTKFAKGAYASVLTKPGCPVLGIACAEGKGQEFYATKKTAFVDFFAMAAECPPYCFPGTETNDGLTDDTNGICITGEDFGMFGAQITNMPVYKNMGTNNKIPAGKPADLCRMAHQFVDAMLGVVKGA